MIRFIQNKKVHAHGLLVPSWYFARPKKAASLPTKSNLYPNLLTMAIALRTTPAPLHLVVTKNEAGGLHGSAISPTLFISSLVVLR